MAVTGSPFCEHKKLKTACALCREAALAAPQPNPLRATTYTSRDDRDEVSEKRAARVAAGKPADPKAPRKLGGPAKPLMPSRARKQKVTAEDAERAQAWWVTKK